EARRDEAAPAAPPAPAPQAVSAPAQAEVPKADDEIDPAQLPPLESLGKDSDYSLFLRKGVPEELRRQALRRMWQSDPVLAMPDVSEPYTIDFNNVQTFADGLKRFYPEMREMLDAETKGTPPAATEPPSESASPKVADRTDPA